MLLGMDVLGPEQVDIFNSTGYARIGSCEDIQIPMAAWYEHQRLHKVVRATENVQLAPGHVTGIPIAPGLRPGQRAFFQPREIAHVGLFTAVIDDGTAMILAKNLSTTPVILPRNRALGQLRQIAPETRAMHVADDKAPAASTLAMVTADRQETRLMGLAKPPTRTVKHPIGVNIYNSGKPEETQALYQLVDEFAAVFQDKGFAKVPADEHMRVQFKDGWQDLIPKKCRCYPVGPADRKVIEDTMDKLVQAGKANHTTQQVPFAWPVFVVWTPMKDGERKSRMVVDIRGLNTVTLNDAYPMKRQEDITAKIANASHITIMNAMSFYYQWQVHPSSQWAFTIVTHRGQYTFTVPIMGYKGSGAYVQRRMDNMLRHTASDAYCDDIMTASTTFQRHWDDLRHLFMVLLDNNISIGATKTFIGFPMAEVLGKMVDSLGMATTDQKLAAIRRLTFPKSLQELEHLLGFAGALCHNVPRFAHIVQPLQERKTNLLGAARLAKGAPKSGSKPARTKWAKAILMTEPSRAELDAFNELKKALTHHRMLTFFAANRQLFVDFDTSSKGIGVMVYHVAEDKIKSLRSNAQIIKYPPRISIQPIAFLSRTLVKAELRYYSTELEICGYVWMLRKARHWIEATEKPPVICFTDHHSIVDMSRQLDIANTSSRHAVNKKLVRALEYISQFSVKPVHKPGKDHVVPDALSRLPTAPQLVDPEAPGQLEDMPDDRPEYWDACHGDHGPVIPNLQGVSTEPRPTANLFSMSPDFKRQIQQGYQTQSTWQNVAAVIRDNDKLPIANRAQLPFH